MKKILSLALALMLTVLLLPVNAEAAEKKKVELNKSSVTLNVGQKTTLKNTGTAKKVKWSSSKSGIATVSQKGVVTAKKAGKTTITVKAGKKVAKCTVTVNNKVTAKQVIKKANKQLRKIKNFSIKAYIGSIKKQNMYMAMGVNIASETVYIDMSMLGIPKMYVNQNKTYWQDTATNKWHYFTSDSDDTEFVDTEDLEEGFETDAKYKLLSSKKFNGKKCTVVRMTDDGETTDFYFNPKNYDLVGATQGSGSEKVIMIIDTKTTVKIPANAIDSATFKEFTFE